MCDTDDTFHSREWLVYSHLQQGRISSGLDHVEYIHRGMREATMDSFTLDSNVLLNYNSMVAQQLSNAVMWSLTPSTCAISVPCEPRVKALLMPNCSYPYNIPAIADCNITDGYSVAHAEAAALMATSLACMITGETQVHVSGELPVDVEKTCQRLERLEALTEVWPFVYVFLDLPHSALCVAYCCLLYMCVYIGAEASRWGGISY